MIIMAALLFNDFFYIMYVSVAGEIEVEKASAAQGAGENEQRMALNRAKETIATPL
jgi:hypothetical protein